MKIYFDSELQINDLMEYYGPCIVQIGSNLYVDLHSTNILNFLMLDSVREYTDTLFGRELKCIEYLHENQTNFVEFRDLTPLDEKSFENFKVANVIVKHVKMQKSYTSVPLLSVENTVYGMEISLSLNKQYMLAHTEYFSNKGFVHLLDFLIAWMLGQMMKGENIKIASSEPLMYKMDLSQISEEKALMLEEMFTNVNLKMVDVIDGLYDLMLRLLPNMENVSLIENRDFVVKMLLSGQPLSKFVQELRTIDELFNSIRI